MPSNSTAPTIGVVRFTPVVSRKPAAAAVPAGIRTLPVKVGEARLALRFRAVCWAVDTGLLASEVLFTFPSPTISAVIPPTVPVKVGEARLAFASRAVCWAVDTGLLASEVLVTFPSPTIPAVIPPTVPVKVGEARLAFASRAVCWAVDTGLLASEVLVTFPSPTIPAVIPPTVPVKVGESSGALRLAFPSSLPKAERIVSPDERLPVEAANPASRLPVTVESEMDVAPWVPDTSPARSPRKFSECCARSATTAKGATAKR